MLSYEGFNNSLGNGSEKIRTDFPKDTPKSMSSVIQAVILIILGVLIVVGNSLTMLTVLWLRKRCLVVDVLIFSLALVDVMNALTSVTIAVLMRLFILRDQEFPRLLCQAQGWCIVAFEMMSVFVISMICFDRYVAIVKPFWHRSQMTCTRTVKATIFASVLSILVASCPLLGWDTYRQLDWLAICLFDYRSSYAIFIAIFGYVQLIFVFVSSMAIVHSLRKFSDRQRRLKAKHIPKMRMEGSRKATHSTSKPNHGQKQSRQLAKIGMIVVVFFYMSWLPLMVSYRKMFVLQVKFSHFVEKRLTRNAPYLCSRATPAKLVWIFRPLFIGVNLFENSVRP